MSEREQLRSALASRLSMRSDVDAVLAVLDQQGWPDAGPARAEVRNLERQIVVMGVALDQAEAERDAALREAARYEPTLACLKRLADEWQGNRQGGFWFRPDRLARGECVHEPMTEAEQEVMATLYRQVTEGEEG